MEDQWPDSLRTLLGAALRDFPDQEESIRRHIEELSHLLQPAASPGLALGASVGGIHGAEAAEATCQLTADDPLTLLFKFEEYLESLLAKQRHGSMM